MSAIEDPEHYQFRRGGAAEAAPVQAEVAWFERLTGAALERWLSKRVIKAVVNRHKKEAAPPNGLGLRGKGVRDGITLDDHGTGSGKDRSPGR